MRYFTSLADQSFKTAPSGERLFYPDGPWTRPYIMPDATTEQRLYRKMVWMYRILLGGTILGLPILFWMVPHILDRPLYFVGCIVAMSALYWLVGRVLFAPDLAGLHRVETRLPLKVFFGDMGGVGKHVFGIVACLMFVAAGIWMLMTGQSAVVAIVNIVFFGLCGVAWAYALFLNRAKSASVRHSQ